jgi:hypothetical protein
MVASPHRLIEHDRDHKNLVKDKTAQRLHTSNIATENKISVIEPIASVIALATFLASSIKVDPKKLAHTRRLGLPMAIAYA